MAVPGQAAQPAEEQVPRLKPRERGWIYIDALQ